MMPVRRANQTWLPSIFNDFLNNDWMVKANPTAPAINVIETEKEYKVEVAAPGMKKEDIHLDYKDGILTISGEKNEEKEINVTFPKDYPSEDLKGKDVVFKVKVNEIKEKVRRELDKEFFEDLGMDGVDSLETLEKHVEEHLKEHKKMDNENT